MGDPQNQAFYQVPVEDHATPYDKANLVATNEGIVPHGGNSALTSNDNILRGTSSPVDPTDWRSTARTPAGAPVLPEHINQSTIVEIQGRRDTVHAFQIIGWLPSDLTQAPAVAKQAEPPKPEDPKDDRPPVPADAKQLWEQTEQLVVPLLEQTGAIGYGAAEAFITGDEKAMAASIQSLSQTTGIEPEEMKATVDQAFKQYEDVARRAVGMSTEEWGLFSSFCDKYPQQRAEASRKVFHQGDLSGIRDLVAQFKAEGGGAAAAANDENVFRACTAQGIRVSRTQNGTTMLHLPQGIMSWREALARGLIEF